MKALTNRMDSSGARMSLGLVSARVREPGPFTHIYQCTLPQDGLGPWQGSSLQPEAVLPTDTPNSRVFIEESSERLICVHHNLKA